MLGIIDLWHHHIHHVGPREAFYRHQWQNILCIFYTACSRVSLLIDASLVIFSHVHVTATVAVLILKMHVIIVYIVMHTCELFQLNGSVWSQRSLVSSSSFMLALDWHCQGKSSDGVFNACAHVRCRLMLPTNLYPKPVSFCFNNEFVNKDIIKQQGQQGTPQMHTIPYHRWILHAAIAVHGIRQFIIPVDH